MLRELFLLEWKSFTRRADLGKSIAVKLLLALFGLYFMVSLLSLGMMLPGLLAEAVPNVEPIVTVNQFLLIWFLFTFVLRMVFQKLPVMNVKPLLVQCVKRGTLVHHTLLKSSFAFNNWLTVVFFVPFAVVTLHETALGYGQLIPWFLAIWSIDMALNYVALYLQSLGRGEIRRIWPAIGLLLAIALVEYLTRFRISRYFGEFFQFLLQAPILVLAPMALCGVSYAGLYSDLKSKLYLDAYLKNQREEFHSLALGWTNRLGALAPFLQMDLHLIRRTKRARSVLIVALLFLGYGLIFYPDPDIKSITYVFVGIFITGILVINYGQFIPSWDGSYYPFLMTLPFSLARYLESKAFLMYISIGIMFLLSTPYSYFGWEVLAVNFACAVYNMGVNVPVILWFGSWNRKRIDLNSGNYFNYQGTGAAQWLVGIPLLVGPLACWGIGYGVGGVLVANGMLLLCGVLGMLLRGFLIRKIASRYGMRKYELLQGFAQTD